MHAYIVKIWAVNKNFWQFELTEEEYKKFESQIHDPQWRSFSLPMLYECGRQKRRVEQHNLYINWINISHFSIEKLEDNRRNVEKKD